MGQKIELEKYEKYIVIYETENPIGIIQIVHGMNEHIGRYEEFALECNKNGYIVVGHNNRGHGILSSKKNNLGVFPENFMVLIDDIKDVTLEVKNRFSNLPLVLLGHSLGSFMVRTYSIFNSDLIDGLIIVGTGQKPKYQLSFARLVTKIMKKIYGNKYRSKFLSFATTGNYKKYFKNEKINSWLSRNEESNMRYAKDGMTKFIPTLSMFDGMFEIINIACDKSNIKNMDKKLPIFVISGSEDPVGNFSKEVVKLYDFMKKNNFENLDYKIYKNARHEILNEINRSEVYEDIFKWIKSKIKKRS